MDPDEILLECVKEGDIRLAEVLLKGGAKPMTVINDATALHIAAGKDDASLTELILQYGGDPNLMPSEDALTPLQVACAFNQCHNVELLLYAGGNPLLKDSEGYDCLQFAEEAGCGRCTALIRLQLSANQKGDEHPHVNAEDSCLSKTKAKKKPRRSAYMAQDTIRVIDNSPDSNPQSSNGSFHTANGSDTLNTTEEEMPPSPLPKIMLSPKHKTAESSCGKMLKPPCQISASPLDNFEKPSDGEYLIHMKNNKDGEHYKRRESKFRSLNSTRLSEFNDIASGPLHSTIYDFHEHAPPLSATAILNDLKIETVSSLDLSLDSKMRDQLTINSHSSQESENEISLMIQDTPVKKAKPLATENSTLICTPTLTLSAPRSYEQQNIQALPLHHKPKCSSLRDEKIVPAERKAFTFDDRVHGKGQRNGQGQKSALNDSVFTEDESIDVGLMDRYEVFKIRPEIAVKNTKANLSLGSTISLLETQPQDSILSGGDNMNTVKHLSRMHPDFFASPVTSTRIASPDVSLVSDFGAGDAAHFGVDSCSRMPTVDSTFLLQEKVALEVEHKGELAPPKLHRVVDLESKRKAIRGGDSTLLAGLTKEEIEETRRKKSLRSTKSSSTSSSKESTCSCHSGAEKRIIEEDELNLLEIMLSKDALDCSLHCGKNEDSTESTMVYDWKTIDQTKPSQSDPFRPLNNADTDLARRPIRANCVFPKKDVEKNLLHREATSPSRSKSDSGVYSLKSIENIDTKAQPRYSVSMPPCTSDVIRVSPHIHSMSDEELKRELENRGDHPGPILPHTRSAYEMRLAKIMSDPQLVNFNKQTNEFCPELKRAIEGRLNIEENSENNINHSLCRMFIDPSPQRQWREGTEKTSFNYLLLDPRVTQNLPARHKQLSEKDSFETFVRAIFYVGKGKRSRPYQHFKETMAFTSGAKNKASDKVLTILRIWEAGLGVISLHIFQNVLATEAYTRESCMIDALGLHRLTNKQPGQVYCNVQSWSAKKRRMAGVLLLKKAYNIYLHEGERQLRYYDIKSSA